MLMMKRLKNSIIANQTVDKEEKELLNDNFLKKRRLLSSHSAW